MDTALSNQTIHSCREPKWRDQVHPYFWKAKNFIKVTKHYLSQRDENLDFLDGAGWWYKCNKSWLKKEGFASPAHFWAEYDAAAMWAEYPAARNV